jgi:hypothetical protein
MTRHRSTTDQPPASGLFLEIGFALTWRARFPLIALLFTAIAMADTPTADVAKRLDDLEKAAKSAQMAGDNAWMLTSSALVLMMTGPGLALFYCGLVRRKNVLGTMMHSFVLMALVTIIWAVVGYSLAFSEGSPFVGGLRFLFLNGVGADPNPDYAATIPHQTYMVYQLMFAIITPALITGAFAERMKFSAMLLFMTLWILIVYFPLYSLRGIWEAECKYLRGDRPGAIGQTQANREWAVEASYKTDVCRCDALLARLLRSDDFARCMWHFQNARAFANRCGEVDLQLACFHAASELHRYLGDHPQSIAEVEAGILLADTCGFGKYSIDLRVALAETYLAIGGDDNARKALQNARHALDRSEHTDCQYAWGKADELHFCGVAHLRLGERELARQRLRAALAVRESLGPGRIEETQRALDVCSS